MPTLLLGVLILVIVLWGAKSFARTPPKQLVRLTRYGGGMAAIAVATLLGARGLGASSAGVSLAGSCWVGCQAWPASCGKKSSADSRVFGLVEMELDHDTGAMRGRILAGPHEGVALDALPVATLAAALPEIDEESRALLMAYLDRRDARWRENSQTDPSAGRGGFAGSGKMTEQEAYQILGIESGASADEVGRAHRALMKKLHPDQGGSTYLAARVNEAKETLLRRHR